MPGFRSFFIAALALGATLPARADGNVAPSGAIGNVAPSGSIGNVAPSGAIGNVTQPGNPDSFGNVAQSGEFGPLGSVIDPWGNPALRVLHSRNAFLDIGGLGQVEGDLEHLSDPYKNDARAYAFLQTARLRMDGGYKGYTFNLELGLGGEETVLTPTDVSLSLLDFAFNVPLPIPRLGKSFIKFGQFLVPYGREDLTYPGQMQFNRPSIDYTGFDVGRDVGLTLNLRNDWVTGIVGVFTGGGRDVPEENLPEKLGVPLLVARIGIGNLDEDPYYLHQNELGIRHIQAGLNINGFYTKDSLVGHSTLLNVKTDDKSLILNGNWNPFIGRSAAGVFTQGDYWQAGIDGAFRMPLAADISINGEAEADYGGYSNKYGAVQLGGARVQGGFQFGKFEVAGRYAVLLPSKNFAATNSTTGALSAPLTGTTPIHEITPAISYYLFGQSLKVTADAPILINAPVTVEKNVGTYVLTDLPNQSTVAATDGVVGRSQIVEQFRVMLQGQF